MRKIAIIPTLLTLGNGICGFAAITFASKIVAAETAPNIEWYFAVSGWLIMAAMVFDVLDGSVARLSKTSSKFGGELDSLCDAVSFGVAPAFMLLKMGPDWDRPFLHQMVAGIAALYMACTLLRLARFNVDNNPDPASHKRFRGLPSPGAAGCLASLAILRGELPAKLALYTSYDLTTLREGLQKLLEVWSPAGALIAALLMVSIVPYPHFANQFLKGKRHVGHLIQLLLGLFIIITVRDLALVAIFWGYAIILPLQAYVWKKLGKENPRLEETIPPPHH